MGLLCVSPAREVASPAGRSIEARGESVPSLLRPWSRPTAPPWEPGLGRRPGDGIAVPAEVEGRPLAGRRHVARLCLEVGVALLATAGRLVGLGLHVRQDVTRGRPPQAPSDKGLFDASVLPGASPRLPGLRCRRPGMAPAPAAGTPGRPSPCAWNCGSRAPVPKSSLFWRLRELVWVGGCITAPATWASPPGRRRRSVHKSAEMAPRGRFGAFVYTVAPWAWVVGGLGIAIVYTNGRIGPLRAV